MGTSNYTRQRQGRDFAALAEGKREREKKSLIEDLESNKLEAERYAAPIDGDEPNIELGR